MLHRRTSRVVSTLLVLCSLLPLALSQSRVVRQPPTDFTVAGAPDTLFVSVMPGYPNAPRVLPEERRPVRPGVEQVIFGAANDGDGSAAGATYTWAFSANPNVEVVDDGDLSGAVSDTRFIYELVTFNLLNDSTREFVTATLTVETMNGLSASRFVELEIISRDDPLSDSPLEELRYDVDIASEEALRRMYLAQGGSGNWGALGSTGYTLWALQNLGHLPTADPEQDIYASTVARGLDYVLNQATILPAYTQPRAVADKGATIPGMADQNANGTCVTLSTSGHRGYETPILCSAIIASLAPDRVIQSGPLTGWTYLEVVEDVADWLAGTVSRGTGSWGGRGGWTYNPYQGANRSDNSINSWCFVALEGGIDVFDIFVPDWFIQEMEYALVAQQTNAPGAQYFGYANASGAFYPYFATTGAGLSGLALAELAGPFVEPGEIISQAPPPLNTIVEKRAAALEWVGNLWPTNGSLGSSHGTGNRGNPYSMWTLARSLRLTAKGMGFESGEKVPLIFDGVTFDWETGEENSTGVLAGPGSAREGYFPWLVRNQIRSGPVTSRGRWQQNWWGDVYATPMYTLILSSEVFLEGGCELPFEPPAQAFPENGSQYAPGTALVLSGQAVPTSPDRPVQAVLVNGELVADIDALGRFFYPVTVAEGLNSYFVTLIDNCGQETFEIQVEGTMATDPDFDETSDVTFAVDPVYTNTTFNHLERTLYFDLAACNVSDAGLTAPVVAIIENLQPVTAQVLQPDGYSPQGRPYMNLFSGQEAMQLGPDDCTEPRTIAIFNPEMKPITFDLRWQATGNRPPSFTTAPTTQSMPQVSYVYDAGATDPDPGDELTFSLSEAPDGMQIDPQSGLITWTTPGVQGFYNVVVRVDDLFGGFAEQAFVVRVVLQPNNAPIVTSVPVLEVDEGALYQYDVEAEDPDGHQLSYSLSVSPEGMTIDPLTGLIEWTPGGDTAGLHGVLILVRDPFGLLATQVYTIEVFEAVNTAPEFQTEPRLTGSEGVVYEYRAFATDADQDTLTYSLLQNPLGMLIEDETGRIRWLPNNLSSGDHVIEVLVEDGRGGTDVQLYTLTIDETLNAPPSFTSSRALAGIEGSLYEYDADAEDPDEDVLAYSLLQAPSGMGIDGASGLISWTPTNIQSGAHAVTVLVDDARGGTDVQSFTVDVAEFLNSEPTILSTPILGVVAGDTYSYPVVVQDLDGDPIDHDLTAMPSGMTIDPGTGLIQWTPDISDAGPHSVSVLVDDNRGGTDTQSYTLTVWESNEPPVITTTPGPNAILLEPYSYDADADDPDDDTLTWTLTAAPAGMGIDASTGLITWTPPEGSEGAYSVSILCDDSRGGLATQDYLLNVAAVNEGPTIVSSPIPTAFVDRLYTYTVLANDPESDPVTYSLGTAPVGMTIGASSGVIQWTPNDTQLGETTVQVFADALGGQDEQVYPLTVEPPPPDNLPPVALISLATAQPVVSSPAAFLVDATDNAGVAGLQLFIDGAPVALTTSGLGGPAAQGTGEALIEEAGVHIATAVATDLAGLTFTDTLTFFVGDPSQSGALTAELASPAEDALLTEVTSIVGTADGSGFSDYVLELAPVGTQDWILLRQGTGAVSADALGEIDPRSLVDDYYDLRLTVRGLDGSTVSDSRMVEVFSGEDDIGRVAMRFDDMRLTVGQTPIVLQRVYDNRDLSSGDFGYGWKLEVASVELTESRSPGRHWTQTVVSGFFPTYVLSESKMHEVRIQFQNGDVRTFRPVPVPQQQSLFPIQFVDGLNFEPVGGTVGSLVPFEHPFFVNPGGPGPVEFLDGDAELYNPSRYAYTDPGGTQLVFEETSPGSLRHKLVQMTDPNGITTQFTTNGILRSDGASIGIVRDAAGRILRIDDPNGGSIQYEYDIRGDLSATIDEEGNRSTFTYDAGHNLQEYFDPLGNRAIRYEFDDAGQISAVIDAAGNRFEVEYGATGNEEIHTDGRGNVKRILYNNEGRKILEERAFDFLGTPMLASQSWAYDTDGNVTSHTDLDGVTTTTAFDADGNIVEEIRDPGGLHLRSTFEYDTEGRLLSMTDATGATTSFQYDSEGNQIAETDPEGGILTRDYDSDGNVVRETDSLGNYVIIGYDGSNNVTSREWFDASDTSLRRREFEYDANGRKTVDRTFRTIDGVLTALETVTEYDMCGNVLSVTDPLGGVERLEYDAAGYLIAEVDKLDKRTEKEYDARGLLVLVRHPDGTTTEHSYDGNANLISTTDRQGRTTTYHYDEFNRRWKTVLPDGSEEVQLLSPGGRVLAEIDANGNRTDHEYDAAGRKERTLRPAVVDGFSGPLVRPETVWTYDGAGRVTSETDPDGRVTTYSHDLVGRRTMVTYDDGTTTVTEYDALGRKTAVTDQAGLTTNYFYDGLGNLTEFRLPAPVVGGTRPRWLYTYDEEGLQLSIQDPLNRVRGFTYDELGRQLSVILPLGQSSLSTYDAMNNVETYRDFEGQTTSYVFDDNHRVQRKDYADGTFEEFSYNAEGTISQVVDDSGTTTLTYDDRDRLLVRSLPGGESLTYTYDNVGGVLSVASSARTQTYSYDVLNRLRTVTGPEGTATYAYSLAGDRVGFEAPNGVLTEMTFDGLHRLESLTHRDSSSSVLASYTYTLEPNGKRDRVEESDGSVVDYSYDRAGRLIGEVRTGTNPYDIDYDYDLAGNRIERVDGGGATTFVYDDNDRLTSAGSTSYTYDDNGARLTAVDGLGTTNFSYDARGRLREVDPAGGVLVTYEHDLSGNRTSRTEGGVTTEFFVDTNTPSGLSQVFTEHAGGGVVAANMYGHEIFGRSAGAPAFFHTDGTFSTRLVTDGAQATTDSYDFEAFGDLVAHAGPSSQPYLFTNQRLDQATGLYHMRAREYDPATGSFLSMDPFAGVLEDPVSLHRYLYAANDPVLNWDPTGETTATLGGMMASVSIINISAAIAFVNYTGILCTSSLVFTTIQMKWLFTQFAGLGLELTRNGLEPGFSHTIYMLAPTPRVSHILRSVKVEITSSAALEISSNLITGESAKLSFDLVKGKFSFSGGSSLDYPFTVCLVEVGKISIKGSETFSTSNGVPTAKSTASIEGSALGSPQISFKVIECTALLTPGNPTGTCIPAPGFNK